MPPIIRFSPPSLKLGRGLEHVLLQDQLAQRILPAALAVGRTDWIIRSRQVVCATTTTIEGPRTRRTGEEIVGRDPEASGEDSD